MKILLYCRNNLLVLFLVFSPCFSEGQNVPVNPALLNGSWSASWITYPAAGQREYGIYHFRKEFYLGEKPASFIIHVTADNRYRLFVNGKSVCLGPARGDLFNWYFESINIASYLNSGKNVIAAVVWNMGTLAPVAQVSNQTGFLLQGDSFKENRVNTDSSWRVYHDLAYTPTSLDNGKRLHAYMVVGPGDEVDAAKYPWGWEQLNYDEKDWCSAVIITSGVPVGYGTDNLWTLAPRNIPFLKETIVRFAAVRRSSGINVSGSFLEGKKKLVIPAGEKVSILLDASVNTVAYPELRISNGKGAIIKMTYTEALLDSNGNKGNRNEIKGKEIIGNYDVFIADGGPRRAFRPLWFRTYRYVQLDIETKDEPLEIEDLYGTATTYPLEMKASFSGNDSSLQQIWKVGWRTARLCAGELYFDCPYYEQLQYTGDSRIQALISLYVSGDDRLMRKAILDFYHSRTPEGLTQGRYPSNRLQIIPTFSLFWIAMIHDYWMLRKDDAFVKQFLPAINEILNWFGQRIDTTKKMLGPMKWWNFVDWDNFNDWGTAPGAANGNSSIMTLQYASVLKQASELFLAFNKNNQASDCLSIADVLNKNTFKYCFSKSKELFADTPGKTSFSQHANIWAILSGAVKGEEAKLVMKHVLTDTTIGRVTFFYRFYLTQALKKAGMADYYYSLLTPWRNMLKLGLTTFAEKPEPTRSDCHAWSASPDYDFLATICGIMPGSPGFKKVIIRPALGELKEIHGTMPHPNGMIEVSIKRNGKNGIEAEIILPENITGYFVWKEKTTPLHGGKQFISQK